jgi:hypothetical protein
MKIRMGISPVKWDLFSVMVSIKHLEFLYQQSDHYLLKMVFAPCAYLIV